jgi:hypothetical protein
MASVSGSRRAGCTRAASCGRGTLQPTVSLTQKQFHALVVGLPWQRIEQLKVIATM